MPKAVRFHEFGGPEVLKIEELPAKDAGPDEVALDVAAIGLNRAESMFFHDQYVEHPQLPSGLGYEAVGTVTAVGANVDASLIGKRVATIPGFSMNRYATLAEKAIIPASAVGEVPATLSDVEAAAVWMQYATAYGVIVELGKVGPSDFVLITAASSSVGLAAIQTVEAQGGISIAATRTSAKKQLLLELGADYVVATQEEDLAERVKAITGGALSRVVFDPVGGDYINTLAQATATEGTIYLYGMLSGQATPFPMAGFVRGVAVAGYVMSQMLTPERLGPMKKYIFDKLADSTFKPKIARIFAFEDVVEAYRYLESNQHVGKLVLTL